jgi:hypothetical protein
MNDKNRLENRFPMIGKVSNDWKNRTQKFPTIGKTSDKISNGWKTVAIAFLAVLCAMGVATANIPQPSCVLYGQVRSAYGWPLMNGELLVTLDDGTEFITDIAIVEPGINFVMSLPLDDGKGIPYDEDVAFKGDRFSVSVVRYGIALGVIETNLPAVAGPGSVVCMNVTAGTDSDGDGIPDEWELEFVENSGGAFTNINQITRDADFDGDGFDNFAEYRSGTLPYLSDDYFRVEQIGGAQDRMAITFFGEKGFSYQPQVCEALNDPAASWTNASFSTTATGAYQEGAVVGQFGYMTIYLSMTNVMKNIRMVVE